MKIVKQNEKEWLQKIGYSKKILLDEKDLNYRGGLVQLIKVKPGEAVKDHYHKKQTEIFYFLTENGSWVIKGGNFNFKIGDILVIEPGDTHSPMSSNLEDYVYLAFKFNYDQSDYYES